MSSHKRKRDPSPDSRKRVHGKSSHHATRSRSRSFQRLSAHRDRSTRRHQREHSRSGNRTGRHEYRRSRRDRHERGISPIHRYKKPRESYAHTRDPFESDIERRPRTKRGQPCRERDRRSSSTASYSGSSHTQRSVYSLSSYSSSHESRGRSVSDCSTCVSPSHSSNDERGKRDNSHDRHNDKVSKNKSGELSNNNTDQTKETSSNQNKEKSSLLELLGESPQELEVGPPVEKEIANMWQQICKKGVSKECKNNLIKKYLIPENCLVLRAPKLNPEIKSGIGKSIQRRDQYQANAQNQLGTAIAAVTKSMTILTSDEITDISDLKKCLFEINSDIGKILTDLHYSMSISRRATITPTMKPVAMNVANETEISEFLYGHNFSERLKTAKDIEKAGNDVAKQDNFEKKGEYSNSRNYNRGYTKSRNDLNYKGPLRRNTTYSRFQRGQKQQFNRSQNKNYRKK